MEQCDLCDITAPAADLLMCVAGDCPNVVCAKCTKVDGRCRACVAQGDEAADDDDDGYPY